MKTENAGFVAIRKAEDCTTKTRRHCRLGGKWLNKTEIGRIGKWGNL